MREEILILGFCLLIATEDIYINLEAEAVKIWITVNKNEQEGEKLYQVKGRETIACEDFNICYRMCEKKSLLYFFFNWVYFSIWYEMKGDSFWEIRKWSESWFIEGGKIFKAKKSTLQPLKFNQIWLFTTALEFTVFMTLSSLLTSLNLFFFI